MEITPSPRPRPIASTPHARARSVCVEVAPHKRPFLAFSSLFFFSPSSLLISSTHPHPSQRTHHHPRLSFLSLSSLLSLSSFQHLHFYHYGEFLTCLLASLSRTASRSTVGWSVSMCSPHPHPLLISVVDDFLAGMGTQTAVSTAASFTVTTLL